jgi:hypothetical protein
MPHPSLERFGQFVISNLHDSPYEYARQLCDGELKSPETQNLQERLSQLTPEQRAAVLECVNASTINGMHSMLFRLMQLWEDDDEFSVIVDGVDVATLSDGLEGEIFSDSGWIAKFSQLDLNTDA